MIDPLLYQRSARALEFQYAFRVALSSDDVSVRVHRHELATPCRFMVYVKGRAFFEGSEEALSLCLPRPEPAGVHVTGLSACAPKAP
jgi:hypothetical protein